MSVTQHTAIHTDLGVKGRHRRAHASCVLALALSLLFNLAQAQSAPLATATQELTPLAYMLVGTATGRSTVAANVPALMGPAHNTDRALAQVYAEVNRFTPVPFDQETTLAQCSLAQKKNPVFVITLTNYTAHSAASQGFRLNFVPILQKNVRNNDDVRILTHPGLSLVYRYRGNDRGTMGDMPVNESICDAL